MERRAFVKACVGVAGAAALGSAGLGMARSLVEPRGPSGIVRYFGAHRVGGPAPRGLPYLPLRRDADGALAVNAEPFSFRGATYDPLAWCRYCGHQSAPGLVRGAALDDRLRYWFPPDLGKVVRPWYADKLGEPVRPEDFPDVGFGARVVWRTPDGAPDAHRLQALVVRVPALKDARDPVKPAKPLQAGELALLQERVFLGDLVAVFSACTHFCCWAGYKEAEVFARPRNAWENAFCTCHDANYDAAAPVAYTFLPS